jgi:hypothetical protein
MRGKMNGKSYVVYEQNAEELPHETAFIQDGIVTGQKKEKVSALLVTLLRKPQYAGMPPDAVLHGSYIWAEEAPRRQNV